MARKNRHDIKNDKGFGERLKEAFDGKPNTEIARELGVSDSAVTLYVKGRIPSATTLIEISNLTRCNLHWLLTGVGKKNIKSPETGTRSAAGLFQSQQIFGGDKLEEFAEILYNHIWVLCINPTESALYTSDNPVVMHTPLKNQLRGVGIASPGIEIAFPLSSKRVLTLADRNFYGSYDIASDGKCRDLEADNVTYYNSLQVLDSERQVYCEESDFALVEDMIKKNPDLRKSDRNRVNVKFI